MNDIISSNLKITPYNSGFIKSITILGDSSEMDWVLEESEWGKIEHFNITDVQFEDGKLTQKAMHDTGLLETSHYL